jgi:hypothetical protein
MDSMTDEELKSYRIPMQVKELRYYPSYPDLYTYPLCPRCGTPLDREYIMFCNHCGQALGWDMISNAIIVIAQKPDN